MKGNQGGFTLIELLVSVTIVAGLALGAATILLQIFPAMERNARVSAACQAQDAGYWLSRDCQMAESISTDSLEPLNLVVMTWTERDYQTGSSVYHSITYSLADLADNVGDLKRVHWSNHGLNQETIVAKHVYYNTGDPGATSAAAYAEPELTVQLTSRLGEMVETRQYRVTRRTNF